MTTANKNLQSQGKPKSIATGSKPKGRRLTLKEFKIAQKAELDKLLKAYGA